MTALESRLVGYLTWVDDEDFLKRELAFLRRLRGNPDVILLPRESRFLTQLHALRGY